MGFGKGWWSGRQNISNEKNKKAFFRSLSLCRSLTPASGAWERERERYIERDRQRERHRQTHTERERERERGRERETDRQTDSQPERELASWPGKSNTSTRNLLCLTPRKKTRGASTGIKTK